MSDPTKKSIVINKSFLSNSGAGSELNSGVSKNKSRKQTRQKIPDEVIKPSKLKQILLDKINAKRKAELTMTTASPSPSLSSESTNHKKHRGYDSGRAGNSGSTNSGGIDKEKEARIFSDEFKKSLSFLDKYIIKNVDTQWFGNKLKEDKNLTNIKDYFQEFTHVKEKIINHL